MRDIEIEYTSLAQAMGDLGELESELMSCSQSVYSGKDLITESDGKMYDAVNAYYREMVQIEERLRSLVGLTKQVVSNIGVAFEESENQAQKRLE